MDNFVEVNLKVRFAHTTAIEAWLVGLGSLSTQVLNTPSKFHLEDGDEVWVKGIFLFSEGFEEHFLALAQKNEQVLEVKTNILENQDWQKKFVDSCKKFSVTPEILILPSFDEEALTKDEKEKILLKVDPENAFGTGRHETTKLCLTAIYSQLKSLSTKQKEELKALDVGCGSGILAILMGKMGVKSILATDIDASAIDTAGQNFQKNDVIALPVLVDEGFLYKENTFDLVVANILSGTLIQNAANLSRCLKSGGKLILSGVLVEQAEEVQKIYLEHNLEFLFLDKISGWVCLGFSKR